MLVLTTRGRRTGLPRTTAVSFMPVGERFVVFSGFQGVSSNWYRNIRANPDVQIRVGRQRVRASARLVEDAARRAELMRQMAARSSSCGPPKPTRSLLKLMRIFDYEGEIRMAVAAGGTLPVIEITPR